MKLRGALIGVLVVLAVSGCTGARPGQSSTHSSTPRSTPSAPIAAPTTGSPYVSDAASTFTITDGDDTQVTWLSPSKNIACGIVLTGTSANLWGCSVDDHTWVAPDTNPGDICYNAGEGCGSGIQAMGVGKLTGRGQTIFESQRAIDGGIPPAGPIRTLAYGHSVTADGVTCVSLETGMTCTNSVSGNGFTLSKSTYSIH